MSSTTSSTLLPQTQTTTNDELLSRYAFRQGLLGALAVISQVLAIRAVLLVSVLGAIFLAYLALAQDDVFRLGVLSVYFSVVVAPVVALTYRRGCRLAVFEPLNAFPSGDFLSRRLAF